MNRWIHVLFLGLAVLAIGALFTLRPEIQGPETARQPSSTDPVAPVPTSGPSVVPPSDLPTLPPLPSPPPPGGDGTNVPCPPLADLGQIRVASFNIHGGVARNGAYRLADIAEEIRAWEVDVVLIQEIHRFRRGSALADMPQALASQLGMDYAFGVNFTLAPEASGAPRRESGTAIVSRFPITDWENTLLPNSPGLQQRGLLRATLDLRGYAVDFYSTHLDHQSSAIRLAQARAIGTIAAKSDNPFVLGGDFNASPGSPPMRAVATYATDAWPLSGEGQGLTMPASNPRLRIDYLLFRGIWAPRGSYVVTSAVSDHRALLTDFGLKVPSACSGRP
ncbi:MAG: endonuclease/exonuclease/phosphatase family protein [Nocardioides sp.]